MEIQRKDKVELKITVEDRDYIFLVPIGAQLKEAAEVSVVFASSFQQAWEEFSKKQKEDEEKASSKETQGGSIDSDKSET